MKKEIILPSELTKNCWFYKGNEKLIEPFLGRYYISYSTASSWTDYRADFIKQKLAGIKLPDGVYSSLGNYLGTAMETGVFPSENPFGFTGQENLALIDRPADAKYERMVLIDMGEYVFIGFIDKLDEYEKGIVHVQDLKSGGKGKEATYASKEYTQVVLYAHALEKEGYKIGKTSVWFVRRTGSHISPPLHISSEQFEIPLEYNQERVDYALAKLDKAVREISEFYKVFLKFFAQ